MMVFCNRTKFQIAASGVVRAKLMVSLEYSAGAVPGEEAVLCYLTPQHFPSDDRPCAAGLSTLYQAGGTQSVADYLTHHIGQPAGTAGVQSGQGSEP